MRGRGRRRAVLGQHRAGGAVHRATERGLEAAADQGRRVDQRRAADKGGVEDSAAKTGGRVQAARFVATGVRTSASTEY